MNPYFLSSLFEGGPEPGKMSTPMKERLIVLGAMFVVSLIVLGWAVLFRRKRRRAARRAERHRRRQSFGKNTGTEATGNHNNRGGEHRRRRHRPRNPTLAETGGLPPVRQDTRPS